MKRARQDISIGSLRSRAPTKPCRLNLGDTIGLVAPASPPPVPDVIDRSFEWLKSLGFKVKLARNVRKRRGFLAGTDRERAADLMEMFQARNVQAILCIRGGYGSGRLLPLLNYDVIRANPKIFVGYSDITALHCALLKKGHLVSFHGPMLNSDFSKKELPAFTLQSFRRTLMQPSASGSICKGQSARNYSVLYSGTASGRLIGGNLSVLCTTLGTPYQPSFKNRILFFEDVDERPYRIDRMLTQLLNAGLLQEVAGVAVGINRNCCDSDHKKTKEQRQTLDDVLNERLSPLKVPVVMGLPFGHVPLNATLPFGVRATLDATKPDLIITEAAVT